ncbi:class I SAM-dependent methyltransferase [Ammoniphilus sp. 3BR4]|uniref:class I SAM-dependent methyltransferase n=1 Tax=Ammoniphilus sp. 3BR4 TaxID=3158265 RepID=UPI0034674264
MEHKPSKVRIEFDQIAGDYDKQRRKLIPCFDDFYQIPVSIAETNSDSPNILDIGAGTGLFSAKMLEKHPRANVTLIDISEKMLEVAKSRFHNKSNVKYIVDDYIKHEFKDTFDIVISSLSIHHLTDTEKKDLYAKVFSILTPHGIFLNADQVLGSTPFIESLYKLDWQKKVESSGLSKDEILSAYERTKLDKMSTLGDQLNWLQSVGFSDVDCIYKYFNFVVLFGRKLQ